MTGFQVQDTVCSIGDAKSKRVSENAKQNEATFEFEEEVERNVELKVVSVDGLVEAKEMVP